MDRIQPPGELGFMILTEDGRLADSGGDLKNKDHVANIINQMKNAFEASSSVLNDQVHSVTIQFEDHLYVLVFEPRRSLVVKRRKSLSDGDVYCNQTILNALVVLPKSFVIAPEFNDLTSTNSPTRNGSTGISPNSQRSCTIAQVNYRLYPTFRIIVNDFEQCGVTSTRRKDTSGASVETLLLLHLRFPVIKSLRTNEDTYATIVCSPHIGSNLYQEDFGIFENKSFERKSNNITDDNIKNNDGENTDWESQIRPSLDVASEERQVADIQLINTNLTKLSIYPFNHEKSAVNEREQLNQDSPSSNLLLSEESKRNHNLLLPQSSKDKTGLVENSSSLRNQTTCSKQKELSIQTDHNKPTTFRSIDINFQALHRNVSNCQTLIYNEQEENTQNNTTRWSSSDTNDCRGCGGCGEIRSSNQVAPSNTSERVDNNLKRPTVINTAQKITVNKPVSDIENPKIDLSRPSEVGSSGLVKDDVIQRQRVAFNYLQNASFDGKAASQVVAPSSSTSSSSSPSSPSTLPINHLSDHDGAQEKLGSDVGGYHLNLESRNMSTLDKVAALSIGQRKQQHNYDHRQQQANDEQEQMNENNPMSTSPQIDHHVTNGSSSSPVRRLSMVAGEGGQVVRVVASKRGDEWASKTNEKSSQGVTEPSTNAVARRLQSETIRGQNEDKLLVAAARLFNRIGKGPSDGGASEGDSHRLLLHDMININNNNNNNNRKQASGGAGAHAMVAALNKSNDDDDDELMTKTKSNRNDNRLKQQPLDSHNEVDQKLKWRLAQPSPPRRAQQSGDNNFSLFLLAFFCSVLMILLIFAIILEQNITRSMQVRN